MKTASSTSRNRRAVLAFGVICALLFLSNHYRLTVVIGQSMLPNYNTGDLLLVDRHAYRETQPQRGDVVVARYQNGHVVKRIAGLPGEEVEVRYGQLYINGVPLPEPQAIEPGNVDVGKGHLFDDRYATLGDNRAIPASRAVHPVIPRDQIVGKVIYAIHLRKGA